MEGVPALRRAKESKVIVKAIFLKRLACVVCLLKFSQAWVLPPEVFCSTNNTPFGGNFFDYR
jgi:hypothetical protein